MAVHDQLTIVSVYGHNNGAAAVPSIIKSMEELPGSKGLLLSLERPANLPKYIQWKKIHAVNYLQYSVFMMHCLQAFIKTDYCLIVQDDGWVLNGKNFKDEYYNYDYIGAPSHCGFQITPDSHEARLFLHFSWVGEENVRVVQNGGFSLRSKKFLQACNKHGLVHFNSNEIHGWNEDAQLSAILRPTLQGLGYKYAPDHIAKYFSMEYVGRGFHEEDFDFSLLLGHHAQTRKLVDDMHVVVDKDISTAYGEVEFLDYLQDNGYTVEYRYAAPVEA